MRIILLLILIILTKSINAQNLTELKGSVYDEETNAPIIKASVYINNTTSGTFTNDRGDFILDNIKFTKIELIVSCIGYQTSRQIVIAKSDPVKLIIRLKPIPKELESVTVTPFDKDGWIKWGKIFEDNFIGRTAFSKRCRIKNPEVLRFKRSENNDKLEVYSEGPLNIVNLALGYNIQFELEEFTYFFSNELVAYSGYAYFKELPIGKKLADSQWEFNRKKAYSGSLLHFMRSLYHGTVSEEGFDVYKKIVQNNSEKIRVTKILQDSLGVRIFSDPKSGKIFLLGSAKKSDSLHYYNTVIRQPDTIEHVDSVILNLNNYVSFSDDSIALFHLPFYINIKFNKGEEDPDYARFKSKSRNKNFQLSSISIPGNKSIFVLPNGFFYEGENLLTYGYWAWEGIAEMLPFDYSSK